MMPDWVTYLVLAGAGICIGVGFTFIMYEMTRDWRNDILRRQLEVNERYRRLGMPIPYPELERKKDEQI